MMITTENVLEWIRELPTKAESYYSGTLNSKCEKSFGVYNLKRTRKRSVAVGGLSNTKTASKGISILVHWTSSTRETESAAQAMYQTLEAAGRPVIGGHKVNYIELLQCEPVDVGTDEFGICEYVIEFILHYERSTT